MTEALDAVAGGFAEPGADIERSEDFAGRFPGWARLVTQQHARVSELERLVETLNDRLTHDPFLSASLHNVLSTVTAIRSTSGILATGDELVLPDSPQRRDAEAEQVAVDGVDRTARYARDGCQSRRPAVSWPTP